MQQAMEWPPPPCRGHEIVTVIFQVRTGQWDFIAVSANGAGLQVAASLPDMISFAPATDLRLAGWSGGQWVNLSSGHTATGNGEDMVVTGTMMAGIKALAIARIGSTLPVRFTSNNAGELPGCKAAIKGLLPAGNLFTRSYSLHDLM